ncbi:glycosyltransferase [Actinocorallia sp. API 0066]|uniref:glycosyltransferase family 2 protein n=1 Tax=Actinocorallia sp. API 0066 TaxID=2896846 RepID=UPI001E4222FC|nr:glycosyltransferase [Actinocorallia sp. API 0066]MCD0450129.1 glycosyltransferase [Actinocorallia sp. API 0066]
MSAQITAVISSLNGEARIGRALDALAAQTLGSALEIVVVDDGSTDRTADVARARGARVVVHERNQGVSAARNSGARAATAPVVAFLDDDCAPPLTWAAALLAGYEPGVTGVGGPVEPEGGRGFLARFVARNNRHQPQELALTRGHGLPYRLYLYLRRQWTVRRPVPVEDVYALTGSNMSFRRDALLEVGGFDARFRFGGEEEDLTRRLRQAGHGVMRCVQAARLTYTYEPTPRALLRHSVAYGRGNALHFRKWPEVRPTVFPWPFLVAALLLAGVAFPPAAVAGLLAPLVLYPVGLRNALRGRPLESLADPYLRLAQEACENVGFAHGAWKFRDLPHPPEAGPHRAPHPVP